MTKISERVEDKLQARLAKAKHVKVDLGVCFFTFEFFRYVEGSKHISGSIDLEQVVNPPWKYYVPAILWNLFCPQRYVVVLQYPLRWDNEEDEISPSDVDRILDQIEIALKRIRKRYKIRYERHEVALRMA